MTPAIATEGLTRVFGDLRAVDSVDLLVAPGTIYGFLGRNGAGKTTLIRMLLGLIGPTAGTVSLLGRPVDSRGGPSGPWARVGYLVDGPGLYPQLSVADHLELARRYRHLDAASERAVVELLELGPYLPVRSRHLSMGNRQRLGLALALIHDPELLILDEPTNGMDPAGVAQVRAMLVEISRRGTTVFMSTHIVTEVERIADHVGIIDTGRLIETLSRQELQELGRPRLTLTMATPGAAVRAVAALTAKGYTTAADGAVVTCPDEAALASPEDVVTALVMAGAPPHAMAVEQDTLEQHFLAITGGRDD